MSQLSSLADQLYDALQALDDVSDKAHELSQPQAQADYYKNTVIPAMEAVRTVADGLEMQVGTEYWPYPSYGDLLFSV